ncbi:hypothetical protein C1646_673274 [Rhizophagus diaphanus]|nr:hypothetical protein C1646_673274 [Rhizophagus diaphanus] [Rhizophagus sp. MUCL 43196]
MDKEDKLPESSSSGRDQQQSGETEIINMEIDIDKKQAAETYILRGYDGSEGKIVGLVGASTNCSSSGEFDLFLYHISPLFNMANPPNFSVKEFKNEKLINLRESVL